MSRGYNDLKDQALLVALGALARQEGRARSMLKHLADALVGPGRALEVLVGADLLADFLTLKRSVSIFTSWAAQPRLKNV